MNAYDLLPTVTGIIKYDLFPNYLVVKGKLRKDGAVQLSESKHYRPASVIQVLPESEYEAQKDTWDLIEQVYREKERQLRVDILKCAGVKFVTVK